MENRDTARDIFVLLAGSGLAGILAALPLGSRSPFWTPLLAVGSLAFVAGFSGLLLQLRRQPREESLEPAPISEPPSSALLETPPLPLSLEERVDELGTHPLNARAFELLRSVKGKTDFQAETLTSDLLGGELTVRGRVVAATDYKIFSSLTIALTDTFRQTAFLIFDPGDQTLLALHKDEIATFRGRIKGVRDNELSLVGCQLVH